MGRDYLSEATRPPYELELDNGEVVGFADPHRLGYRSALDAATESDPVELLRLLLSDRFDQAWLELRAWPADEVEALLDDVFDHYGATRYRAAEVASLLEHYGEAIEADLHERFGLDLLDFFTGRLPVNKLANLVDILQKRRTSYLTWAISTDTDLYRNTPEHKRRPAKKKPPPELFEYGLLEDMAAEDHALAQQQIHATYTAGTKKARSRPKITAWPRPRTARDLVEREDARAAHAHLESVIVFAEHLPPDQQPANGST